MKFFGNRINIDDIENIINKLGYECACNGTDDNLNIYLTNMSAIDEIKSHLTEKVRLNKKALTFFYIEVIPRNESGKIMYSLLGTSSKEIGNV